LKGVFEPHQVRESGEEFSHIIFRDALLLLQGFHPGMSEIRDRAQAALAKSRKFRDNGLPVSG
jgi:hypothetical protein